MAILDDNDPVTVLSSKFLPLLDKQDGDLAIAALASVLASLIGYAHAKTHRPLTHSWEILRDDLMDVVMDYVRAREQDKHARS